MARRSSVVVVIWAIIFRFEYLYQYQPQLRYVKYNFYNEDYHSKSCS